MKKQTKKKVVKKLKKVVIYKYPSGEKVKKVVKKPKAEQVDYRYTPLSYNLRVLMYNDDAVILVDRVTHCLYVLIRSPEGYQLQLLGV